MPKSNKDEYHGPIVDESEDSEEETFGEEDDERDMNNIGLDADTFGMSLCSLTRDCYHLGKDGFSCARVTRLIISILLVILTVAVQVLLLYYTKVYVCAASVHNIRIAYSDYEYNVYGCEKCTAFDPNVKTKCLNYTETGHCFKTVNGKWRGLNEYYPGDVDAERILRTLAPAHQEAICHIPLSHPHFFGLVLFIWLLAALTEVKKSLNLLWVILALPNARKMKDIIDNSDGGEVIVAMPCFMKITILILTLIPRLLITGILTWVGCRWLVSITNFGGLVMSSVSLGFVLNFKGLLYDAIQTTRSHHDLAATSIVPHPKRAAAVWYNFASSKVVLLLAVLGAYLYIRFFQQVLPGYNWDVREVCLEYLKEQYSV